MKTRTFATLPMICLAWICLAPERNSGRALADSSCSFTLGPRTACVVPQTTRQARADGGIIEVQAAAPNVISATLTGTVAANAFLGCSSTASQTFHLEQEFEVAGPQASTQEVALTLESNLVGLVRSKGNASAAARLATAKVCPLGSPDSPLVMVHPPFGAGGTCGKLCNQRLTPIKIPAIPVGRYVLIADFVLAAEATGATDAHSAADFSPTTVLPGDWVRSRDPFQGVDKKEFGFKITLTVDPTAASLAAAATPPRDPVVARATVPPPLPPVPARWPSKPPARFLAGPTPRAGK